jgi:hydrogenase maturation factor
MINKKIITPDGLNLLWRIMQTCPATPLNGGEHAKKHLQALCENGEDVYGHEICNIVDRDLICKCEGEIDVYTHLLESTKSDLVGKLEVMEYFGGDVHAGKILSNTKKDALPLKYSLKVIFGHLLIPVIIENADSISAVDSDGISIENLLVLIDDQEKYADGDVVLVHYGFIVGRITRDEMKILNAINKKSVLYHEAVNILDDKMDFATMHYFPRSKKMAGK